MQADFAALRDFDYSQAHIYLWVFKRSTTARKFSAFFVQTDEVLNALLRDVVVSEIRRISEFAAYTHLAETNENSCLATTTSETEFEFLKVQLDRPEPECAARSIRDLKGAEGYAVKFVHNGLTVYAIKRSTSTWKTAYPIKYINMIFQNGELSAAEDNSFSIERSFDFYCLNDATFIAAKRAFESMLKHRIEYRRAFTGLMGNPNFSALFTNLQPIAEYVGNSAIHLRRMAAIEQKGVYAKPDFLANLQRVSERRNWMLNFEPETTRIIPCEQTAKIILQVLLDHRLLSEVTENIYDVPDTTPV